MTREQMIYSSMDDVRRANQLAGKHFFDPASMRFFDSRIGRTLYGCRYFITSEQFHGSNGLSGPRLYTVREVLGNGDITTVGPFNKLTRPQALRKVKKLAATS